MRTSSQIVTAYLCYNFGSGFDLTLTAGGLTRENSTASFAARASINGL